MRSNISNVDGSTNRCHAVKDGRPVQNARQKYASATDPRAHNERALFVVDEQKYIGVVHRLSLTGGSTVLARGPIPEGMIGEMVLNTVFGKVEAQVEFMHNGADGKEHAQAFRFLGMSDVSSKRFAAAARQMEHAGFSDVEVKENLGDLAAKGWGKLRDGVRQLSGKRKSGR